MSDTGERWLFWILPGEHPGRGATAGTAGSKAYHLMQLAEMGLPVPPGFVLGTGLCRRLLEGDPAARDEIHDLLREGVTRLAQATGRALGSMRRPLLVSVRSGAAVSMPGMMQTVLNVGLNNQSVRGLIRLTGNPRMAWDSFRRLVSSYAEIVHGSPAAPFARIERERAAAAGVADARELDADTLEHVTRDHLRLFRELTGVPFPADPTAQLEAVVEAVFRSWHSATAKEYRRLHAHDELAGTAVTVQSMVFGNSGALSGSGVGFTRNPATGKKGLYADFLFGAQGEDVVSGRAVIEDRLALADVLPAVHAQLDRACPTLEKAFGDLQDFEFTVEEGEIYLLQTRSGKRTPWAALQVAVDFVREGLWTPAQALGQLAGIDLDSLVHHRICRDDIPEPLALATPASLGVAQGVAVLDAERARTRQAEGEHCLLVRPDTSTADLAGMAAVDGILTARGGRTSHAAVVARQMGKVCLVGCGDLRIDETARRFEIGGRSFEEGDVLTLDGNEGRVFADALPIETERPRDLLAEVSGWRVNA